MVYLGSALLFLGDSEDKASNGTMVKIGSPFSPEIGGHMAQVKNVHRKGNKAFLFVTNQ
jgi:hypothetical protein